MKNVLITGAAKRIGRGLATTFARTGWHVFIHCNSSQDAARDLQKQIEISGGSSSIFSCDLSDYTALERDFSQIFSDYKIDCLINNASVFEYDHPSKINEDIFQKSLAINLHAPIKISEIYFNAPKTSGGCIINMLDNKVFAINPDFYSYTLAKSSLFAATQMMAMSFSPKLRVCGIAPGITLPSGDQTQADFEKTHNLNLAGVGSSIEEIAKAALFITEMKAYNGQVITIDGGQTLMNLDRDVAFLDK